MTLGDRSAAPAAVDRERLVRRHNPVLTEPHPTNTLSVGNGDFALTVDISGLQTFAASHRLLPDPDRVPSDGSKGLPRQKRRVFDRDHFQIPLLTQSTWGWYRTRGRRAFDRAEADVVFDTPRGPVAYPSRMGLLRAGDDIPDDMASSAWHTYNPRRLHLGRLALRHADRPELLAHPEGLASPRTELDMWTGAITAEFGLDSEPVRVETVAHPHREQSATRVSSELLSHGLGVAWTFDGQADDLARFEEPLSEELAWTRVSPQRWIAWCRVESSHFAVSIRTNGTLAELTEDRGVIATTTESGRALEVTATWFHLASPDQKRAVIDEASADTAGFDAVASASRAGWEEYWLSGAVFSTEGSSDHAAAEVERRVVLSQYLTAVNCAGSTPPAETGLTYNTWTGKFHLEMHWWHAAHFPMWGRGELLERSLAWYHQVLPLARETAEKQGYRGARWPKQTDPSGVESPSSIGVFLLWQQPHIIYLLELLHSHGDGSLEFLERHLPLVEATAEFMADFAVERDGVFTLQPPMIPAQESYLRTKTTNADPTFELAYWSWALGVANTWRSRLGMPIRSDWRDVSRRMRPPMLMPDGSYAAISTPPFLIREDHPSTLMALGWLPDTDLIDPVVMERTLEGVWRDWDLQSTWGWDYPVLAMTAARLGRLDLALDALVLSSPKNVFLANGHNPQIRGLLSCYLPANGGLLAAISHIVAATDRGTLPPGWRIRSEGFR